MVAFDKALDPVYHLADINYSCFVGAQEAYGKVEKYINVISNPVTLAENLGYNLGKLYDAGKDIVTYFTYPERSGAKTP